MPSKHEFIDTETFTITNSSWVQLEKKDLVELPWIREILESKGAKLFLNDCLGFTVEEITEGGGIICSNNIRLYIKKNITRPARFEIYQMYTNPDGIVESDHVNINDIRKVTVSRCYGDLPDGFRVFRDGPNKYYYDKNGKVSTYHIDDYYSDYDY